jgi:hypothetical protein
VVRCTQWQCLSWVESNVLSLPKDFPHLA